MLSNQEISGMFILLLFALVALRLYIRKVSTPSSDVLRNAEFVKFQRNYLLGYFLALFSDWLQGPYLYSLYVGYGYTHSEIGAFFAMGFGSSLIFGTFVGSLADK